METLITMVDVTTLMSRFKLETNVFSSTKLIHQTGFIPDFINSE